MKLSDVSAESAVLAGILQYGKDAYLDVAEIINDTTFTSEENQIIWICFQNTLEKKDKVDFSSILSSANDLHFSEHLIIKHLNLLSNISIHLDNIRGFAKKIRKLQIAREMYGILGTSREKYLEIKGDETLTKILSIAEDDIFNFTLKLKETDELPQKIFKNVKKRLETLEKNTKKQVGISTGFSRFDNAIGGGLRNGTVNVIGARSKVGKTLLADNIGVHIAKDLEIPVLSFDTEMTQEVHQDRLMAMLTKVPINDIETGRFGKNKSTLFDTAQLIEDVPFYYKSIGGMDFEEQSAVIRRWIAREVGLDEFGKALPCVVIYDYLKLMNADGFKGDLKEFQLLGFLMTNLHELSLRYSFPILAFIQLNRDGISHESTNVASGSDRIIWLCSNFTLYKEKSDEEITMDGPEFGNRKLVPLISRFGKGLGFRDYINVIMQGEIGKLTETYTSLEIRNGLHQEDDTEEIPFKSGLNDVPFISGNERNKQKTSKKD